MTLLTIVTITKNDLSGLVRTLNSLPCGDSYHSLLSIHIVNGCPDDHAAISNIIDKYPFSKNISLHNQQSTGLFQAMNEGLFASSTPWIQFINSGDESRNLPRLLSYLSSVPSTQIDGVLGYSSVNTNSQSIATAPLFFPSTRFKFSFYRKILPSLFSVCHQSVVFAREFHIANPYSPLSIGSDFVIISRLLKSNYSILPITLSNFYTDGVSSFHKSLSQLSRLAEFASSASLPSLFSYLSKFTLAIFS